MPEPLSVLIVEDDPNVRLGCVQAMQLGGIPVAAVGSAEDALKRLAPGFAGVVVTDMRLPGADGMALLRRAREIDAELPVIIITGHGDVTLAVEAMRAGAYDFIQKPFAPELLVDVVRRAIDKRRLVLEVLDLRRRLSQHEGIEGKLIGRSPQMEQVRELILQVADSPVDVLVRGETGTGKELVAQALHERSRRRDKPFVALNCGGMPDNLLDSELFGHEAGAFTGASKRRIGKIEYAEGGTLFLDEVESMPMAMQIKLLRVLQERTIERLGSNRPLPVDCRVVAASKDDLLEKSRDGSFRADLYYRLNVVVIELPALRERRDDIPLLVEHFALAAARRYDRPQPDISPDQMRRLMAHDWPGNVRELRHVADCLALGIRKDMLGGSAAPEDAGLSLAESVENFERSLISAELRRQGGSVARCAEALRMAKTTLHDKIRKYGLQDLTAR
ncbi:sigma-54-dependent transcriptional regulator [Derxia lacustris]|uniref:sigma-54-dependent transcriptional regulator n=1 Tax=Derxia lacustris TaxID=764842 RepID=UPI000A170762|nr:sigma-54 dependent transcriptional regulator [Derxia lacustris]